MSNNLPELAKRIRHHILSMTTEAGSGHPTSSLSSVELMTTLFFDGFFHFDFNQPDNLANDRLIFSKGHATPLYYSLFAAAGQITEAELMKYRTFDSALEGHPTPRFPFSEAATGSLGQGLAVGVGQALAIKMRHSGKRGTSASRIGRSWTSQDDNFPNVFVLLGDGEMAEGSVWEAINYAGNKKIHNLIAVLDVNRLGQSQETMYGHDIDEYGKRVASFGWHVLKVVDGHDMGLIAKAYEMAQAVTDKPVMIIAKTIKGKGFSIWEDKENWHSKQIKGTEFENALKELGEVDKDIVGKVKMPQVQLAPSEYIEKVRVQAKIEYSKNEKIATKKAFGDAIERLGANYPELIVFDGDVKNSLHTDQFEKKFPHRFYQSYIAEQLMVSMATGFAKRGFIPFVTTFAAFMTRAHDQIRMAAVSDATILFDASYAGVSMGMDGPSQMGLEDMALFRSLFGSTLLYPADAYSTQRLVAEMLHTKGLVCIRTAREPSPILYSSDEKFEIGGSKLHHSKNNNQKSKVTIIAAGITLFESLKAQQQLESSEVAVDVIDCYSIKPIDTKAITKAAQQSAAIITVEDHFMQGGLGDAVLETLAPISHCPVIKLGVDKMPRSGKPDELSHYEGIDAAGIIVAAKRAIGNK